MAKRKSCDAQRCAAQPARCANAALRLLGGWLAGRWLAAGRGGAGGPAPAVSVPGGTTNNFS